jgi:hypothetical protein
VRSDLEGAHAISGDRGNLRERKTFEPMQVDDLPVFDIQLVQRGPHPNDVFLTHDVVDGFSWMIRSVELSSVAVARVAAEVAALIDVSCSTRPFDERDVPPPSSQAAKPATTRWIKAEVRRLMSQRRSRSRLDDAGRLFDDGCPTMEEAANALGYSRRTLLRDYKDFGLTSPWPHGGARNRNTQSPK